MPEAIKTSSPKTQDELDKQSAPSRSSQTNPDYIRVYKLEEIGSQRTFRVVFGDNYAEVSDRISFSGRTLQPGSFVVVLAPGAETRVFGKDKGIPEPTASMKAKETPFGDIDEKSKSYMDPRPSPEVDPKKNPEMAKVIADQQAHDEKLRQARFEEESRPSTPPDKSPLRKRAEEDARKAGSGKTDTATAAKADAMRKQLESNPRRTTSDELV